MADLVAAVRATRASANALRRLADETRRLQLAQHNIVAMNSQITRPWRRRESALPQLAAVASERAEVARAAAAIERARKAYERAQAILAANPLPGDAP